MEAPAIAEITQWLECHGLSIYLARFIEQDIEPSLLATLSDEDLRELGLTIGHRRRFKEALAARPAEPVRSSPPQRDLERRQLTVMFCDLVGATNLSSRLDPEDLRAVLHQYYKTCERTITEHHGFIASYLGDGLLSYFGYPEAREDAAESAIRAGLSMVEALGHLKTAEGSRIQVRIGIATGMAVVGDLIGEGASELRSVIGQTPNLAARLQSFAQPDTLAIAESTRRLVRGQFDYLNLGVHALKGIDDPVQIWQVVGTASQLSRFQALHQDLGPCVGREHELGQVSACWQQALQGVPQYLLIRGEAGLGKSRLVRQLVDRAGAAEHLELLLQCSPDQSTNPLYPLVAGLRQMIRLDGLTHGPQDLQKIEHWLGPLASPEQVALIGNLIGVRLDALQNLLPMALDQIKVRTQSLIHEVFRHKARDRAMLILIEDAHWIDPVTQAFIDELVRGLGRSRLMLVLTARPEYAPRLPPEIAGTVVNLNRLDATDARALIGHATRGTPLSPELIEQIIERAEGVPLYIEELTKAVVDRVRSEVSDRLMASGIPATLHDSLMGRLDRLGTAKETAQVAACLGRTFRHEVLALLMGRPGAVLDLALQQLMEAELLIQTGLPPQASYTFKHALLQDLAYESLLRSKRRELHARIVEIVEANFPEQAHADPGMMAHHCRNGQLLDKEARYLILSARVATRLVAVKEALGYLSRAEEILAGLPPSEENVSRHIDVILMLLDAGRFMFLPSTLIAYADKVKDMHARSARRHDLDTLASILFQKGRAHLYSSHYDEARSAFCQIVELGRSSASEKIQMKPGSAFTMALCCQGHFSDALAFLDREKLERFREHQNYIDYLAGLGWCGYALCQRGEVDAGLACNDQSIEEGSQLGSAVYGAGAYAWKTHALLACRRHAEAIESARRCVELGQAAQVPYLIWHGLVFLAMAHCRNGDFELARHDLIAVRERLATFEDGLISVLDYPPMIEAEIACFEGDAAQALLLGARAVEAGASRGGLFTEALGHRVLALSRLALDAADPQAARHMDRALELLQRGGARAEQAYSALLWAEALERAGQAAASATALASAMALAEGSGLDLQACEHGGARILGLRPRDPIL
ncbi:MAG: AAA family ATPase [Curvibacter sp.]|nr:AAA family ATPase [Curvibacter sp.]